MGVIRTYVKGLDEHLGGGIPEGHVVLIVGEPGTMKSSLAYSILYYNAKHNGISGIHASLEQSRESLLANMESMGMKIDRETGKRISVLDLGFIRKKMVQLGNQTWLEIFKMYVKNLKVSMDSKILVVDSLPVLEIMSKFKDPRIDLFHLFEWFRDLHITTFLIHEQPHGVPILAQHGEDFLADGVIHIDMCRIENTVKLYLGILKMRRCKHSRRYFPLIYEGGRFEIVAE
ncbi:MAG: circadian clock protein KaiC [Thermoplasmata archaeon]|nr:MAG: circadian clock protein KaiC [Thermoplasmata archaeon]